MEKPKVIIVDDQPENLQILVQILKSQYAVIATTSGIRAIELSLLEPKACAILLDVYMPEIDGFSLCKKLKLTPETENIPVIFITSSTTENDYQNGLESGGYDFIQKPVSATLLLNRLYKAIH